MIKEATAFGVLSCSGTAVGGALVYATVTGSVSVQGDVIGLGLLKLLVRLQIVGFAIPAKIYAPDAERTFRLPRDDEFILDGIAYPNLPSRFSRVMGDDWGPQERSFRTIKGKRMLVKDSAPIDSPNTYTYKRKVHFAAWRAEWTESSLMPVAFYEQLRALYDTQRSFWIQFDAEMSRCWGRLISVGADIEDTLQAHPYFTPTWPIFPYGHQPGDDVDDWRQSLLVEGRLWEGAYTVDRQRGLVLIAATRDQFTDRTKVHLKYTWRAYVRVAQIDQMPVEIAQTIYTCGAVFEQVPVPDSGAELAWRTAPELTCIYQESPAVLVNAPISVVAHARVVPFVHGSSYAPVQVKAFVKATRSGVSGAPIVKTASTVIAPAQITGLVATAVSYIPEFESALPVSSGIGNWVTSDGTTDKAAIVSKSPPSMSTYVYGTVPSQEFVFGPHADPIVHTGHTVTVLWQRTVPVSTTLRVELKQGALVLHTEYFVVTDDNLTYSTFTLTSAEAALITDYTNIRVTVYSSQGAAVGYLRFEVPPPGAITTKYRTVFATIAVNSTAVAYRPSVYASAVLAPVVVKTILTSAQSYNPAEQNEDEET